MGLRAAPARPFRLVLLGLLSLAPVWLPPVLPTTQGPDQIHDAFVVHDLETGGTTYQTAREVRQGLAPNQVTAVMLRQLGPVLGWRTAERVLASLAILFPLVALLLLAGSLDWIALIVTGMLAQNWFLWAGHFDFALSLALFALLATTLIRLHGTTRLVLTQVLLLALFFTHLFTFVAGLGLVLGWVGWRRLAGRGTVWDGVNALPAVVLLAIELSSAGWVGADYRWGDPVRALAGLIVGDVVVTFHPIYLLAGVALMAAVWWTAARVLLRARREGWRTVNVLTAAGLCLLVLSLVVPDAVREGSDFRARARLLAVLLLLPALLVTLKGLRGPVRSGVLAGGILLLVLHASRVVQLGTRLNRDQGDIAAALNAAGAHPGDWVETLLSDQERGFYRISAYRHLGERLATELGLVVLDNYQASSRPLLVTWWQVPDQLLASPAPRAWVLRRIARELCPSTPVFVVHERDHLLRSADSRVSVGTPGARGAFAVTGVTLKCPS